MAGLKDPHGGVLKNLYLDEAGAKQEKARARDLASWDLNMRQLCDIEMLLNGAFSPLTGFLNEKDYSRVCSEMRLANGVFWPMPVTLDVSEAFAEKTAKGKRVARSRQRKGDLTYDELYDRAKKEHIEGRSKMSKQQLRNALYH